MPASRESVMPFALRGLKVPQIDPNAPAEPDDLALEGTYDPKTQTLVGDYYWVMSRRTTSRHTTTRIMGCDDVSQED